MKTAAEILTTDTQELPATRRLSTKIDKLTVDLLDDETVDSQADDYFDRLTKSSQSLHAGGLYLDESYAGPEDIIHLSEEPDRRMYSVMNGDRLVGGIDIIKTEHPDEVEVFSWIDQAQQGQGFGTASKEAIVDHYTELGFTVVSKVKPANATNIRVLGKLGFSDTGEQNNRLIFKKSGNATRR